MVISLDFFDPEGGRMFIVIDMPDKSTLKGSYVLKIFTYDPFRVGKRSGMDVSINM